jgi:hypothetical protein
MEAKMKKLFIMFEDLWVAVAFAEAGEYESLRTGNVQPEYRETVRLHAV